MDKPQYESIENQLNYIDQTALSLSQEGQFYASTEAQDYAKTAEVLAFLQETPDHLSAEDAFTLYQQTLDPSFENRALFNSTFQQHSFEVQFQNAKDNLKSSMHEHLDVADYLNDDKNSWLNHFNSQIDQVEPQDLRQAYES